MSKEHLQKASEIRRAADERIAAIQSNKELTDSVKSKQIMEIRAWANEQIEAQKRLHSKSQVQARGRAMRRIFGLGFGSNATATEKATVRVSYRDAIFRADRIETPQQAQLFLDRATAIGDAMLSKAVVLIAFERGWQDVLADYAETNESAREPLAELQALDRAHKREQMFLEGVSFSQIAETAEERAARLGKEQRELGAITDS